MTRESGAGARRFRPGRRDVLAGGVGAAVGAAGSGAGWALTDEDRPPGPAREPEQDEPEVPPLERFSSTELRAPRTTVRRRSGGQRTKDLLFVTPMMPSFHGVIYDDSGSPVWVDPDATPATDLRVQEYRGRPVLTYWCGEFLTTTGHGRGVILDQHYEKIAEVRAGNGVLADIHEFLLTPRGTALVIAYPVVPRDLSSLGGPVEGWMYGGRVQEIDVRTQEVLLDWDATEHITLEDSHKELDAEEGEGKTRELPYDPIHLNSVAEDDDGHLLVSARHTWTLYKVDRASGEVIWRFGGKRSDIEVPEGGAFSWQHDLRRQPDGTLTIYDNHGREKGSRARSAAMTFRVDERGRTAELVRALRTGDRYGFAMGNAQHLADGHVVVGWGMAPFVTEFDVDGEIVHELGQVGNGSYRAYRFPWTGLPRTAPDIGTGRDGSVRASWNGATEVTHWRLLEGRMRDDLREGATVRRDGFETVVRRGDGVPFVAVEALDGSGTELARSRTIRARPERG
ncbi:arylsulfotransferase family protein [Janibacter corallicola]|uniref:arylsulfotransferase family protein n=1 Tax=Janibacter corallicola TaxID=415212 RepID=UPI000A054119|nr:arylsulfotransferase family protein [Janibacter corallicola]